MGMEWLSDSEITRRPPWQGQKFRMGRWGGETGSAVYHGRDSMDDAMEEMGGDERREHLGLMS